MPQSRVRFTMLSMMIGMVVLGTFSWIITGMIQGRTVWFSHAPLYMVLASPLLFAAFLTLAVTLVQIRLDGRLAGEERTERAPMEQSK
jgi:hypothetical protein